MDKRGSLAVILVILIFFFVLAISGTILFSIINQKTASQNNNENDTQENLYQNETEFGIEINLSCGEMNYTEIKGLIEEGECESQGLPRNSTLCITEAEIWIVELNHVNETCKSYCIVNMEANETSLLIDCQGNISEIKESYTKPSNTSSTSTASSTTSSGSGVTVHTDTAGDASVFWTQIEGYTGNDATCRTCI